MFSIFTPLRARPRATMSKISVVVFPLPRAAMTSSCSASERCGAMDMSAGLPERSAPTHKQSSCQQLSDKKASPRNTLGRADLHLYNMPHNVYRTDSIPVSAKKTTGGSARDPTRAPATPEVILQFMAALQPTPRKIGGFFRSTKNSHACDLNVNSEGHKGSFRDLCPLPTGVFSLAPDPHLRPVPGN